MAAKGRGEREIQVELKLEEASKSKKRRDMEGPEQRAARLQENASASAYAARKFGFRRTMARNSMKLSPLQNTCRAKALRKRF